METFSAPREFVEHRDYARERERVMSAFDPECIDAPIRDVVADFASLPHCFTLQSCFGHFTWDGQSDTRSLDPVPARDVGSVGYGIAYLAVCIERDGPGLRLRERLADVPSIDPDYVQFGSPGWFWKQHLNSYALQVEPERFRLQDRAVVSHSEALHVQAVRDTFYERIRRILIEERSEL